jgi:hypothetical protein
MIVSNLRKQTKLNNVAAPKSSAAVAAPVVAPVAVIAPQVQASYRQISERAFEIFEKRGRTPGRDMQDWLRAECQLQPTR